MPAAVVTTRRCGPAEPGRGRSGVSDGFKRPPGGSGPRVAAGSGQYTPQDARACVSPRNPGGHPGIYPGCRSPALNPEIS